MFRAADNMALTMTALLKPSISSEIAAQQAQAPWPSPIAPGKPPTKSSSHAKMTCILTMEIPTIAKAGAYAIPATTSVFVPVTVADVRREPTVNLTSGHAAVFPISTKFGRLEVKAGSVKPGLFFSPREAVLKPFPFISSKHLFYTQHAMSWLGNVF